MNRNTFSFSVFLSLAVLAIMAGGSTRAAAQPPAPCDRVFVHWENINYPGMLPTTITTHVTDVRTGLGLDRPTYTGYQTDGFDSLNYNNPGQPVQLTGIRLTDGMGGMLEVDMNGAKPQIIPTLVPGKCWSIDWYRYTDAGGCYIMVVVELVDC